MKLKNIDIKNASQQSDIPTKIIQENSNYTANILYHRIKFLSPPLMKTQQRLQEKTVDK